MIKQIVEEALLGNYTNFAELFKGELSTRLHEAIEEKKQSVIDSSHNMCESCEEEEEEEVEEGYYGNPHPKKKMKEEEEEDYDKDDHTMDPKSHVKKEGPEKFCVYHENGKKVKTFDNKKDAEAYAMENHDDLMNEAYHSKKKKMEAMDTVGKEDGDIDNDGDTDSSDKYLLKRRKAIGKALKKEGAPKKGKSGGGY